jgi:hypothetical protein
MGLRLGREDRLTGCRHVLAHGRSGRSPALSPPRRASRGHSADARPRRRRAASWRKYAGTDRERLVRSIDLADGGVYDNLGIEPVWRDHKVVLVSDAAPSLSVDPPMRAVWKALRYAVTLLEQATEVRKRWLLANFIRGDMDGRVLERRQQAFPLRARSRPAGYSDEFVERFISQVRNRPRRLLGR